MAPNPSSSHRRAETQLFYFVEHVANLLAALVRHPVVYNNNRRAILAIEKGTPGEGAFADAFKAWKQ